MKHDLFISYSRVDSAFALRLVHELKERGVETWFDQLDIPAGANWDNEIEKALDHAQTLIVILSSVSAKSENVKNEIGAALERGKQVVPIVLEKGAVPLMIQRLQREDFTGGDYEAAVDKLVHRLSGGSRSASMRAISPEDVARIASEAAKRLGVSQSGLKSHSLSPATVAPRSSAAPKTRHTLLAAIGGAVVAGGLVLAFAMKHDAKDEQASKQPERLTPVAGSAASAIEPVGGGAAPATDPRPVGGGAAIDPKLAVDPALAIDSKPAVDPKPAPSPLATDKRQPRPPKPKPYPTPEPIVQPTQPEAEPEAPPPSEPEAPPTSEPAKLPAAIFCREVNYGGICRPLTSRKSMFRSGVENDEASSMRLGTCKSVTVCQNDNLWDPCEHFTTDQPDLGRTTIGDNSVSSFECHGASGVE